MEASYRLVYASLESGEEFKFPCNERGDVELDALSDRARLNYLYARAMVGKAMLPPLLVAQVD